MSVIKTIEDAQKKSKVTDVKSGDVVRVHQKIKEGNKERVQVFEGLVIQTKRENSLTHSITVRRIASGVGVEKSFLVHSPLITQIEVVKRSKVRRNNLSYMRERSGKSARLDSVKFDKDTVNVPADYKDAMPEEKEAPKEDVKDEKSEEKPAQDKAEEKKEEPKEDTKAEEQKPDETKDEDSSDEQKESK